MIALEPQLEQQIKNAATLEGLSSSELIKSLFFEYQQEQSSLKKSTTLPFLDPLECSRPIRYAVVENTDERAFIDIEDAAQYGKKLRSSAWNRNKTHD